MSISVISVSRQLQMPIAGGRVRLRVRSDALPEYTRYRDDGCEVNPTCLTCPLPRCRYEEPGGLRALLNATRDKQIIQLRLTGIAVDELADRFSVSRRTVFRVLGTNPLGQARSKTRAAVRVPTPIRPAAGEEREVKYA
jgi:hypothetical protein